MLLDSISHPHCLKHFKSRLPHNKTLTLFNYCLKMHFIKILGYHQITFLNQSPAYSHLTLTPPQWLVKVCWPVENNLKPFIMIWFQSVEIVKVISKSKELMGKCYLLKYYYSK